MALHTVDSTQCGVHYTEANSKEACYKIEIAFRKGEELMWVEFMYIGMNQL